MNSQIRIGHFSPDAPSVNVLLDGNAVLEGVEFGDIGDYVDVDAGVYGVRIVPAAGGDAVLDASIDVDADTAYTVLAVGELEAIRPLVLTDENESLEGRTRVRFVHTVSDAPAVDVGVVDGPTLFDGIEFGEASEYVDVDAGSYDVEVTPAGKSGTIRALSNVELADGEAMTVLAMGLLGEDTVDAILVTDGSRKMAAGR